LYLEEVGTLRGIFMVAFVVVSSWAFSPAVAQVAWKDKTSVAVLKTAPEKAKGASVEILAEEPKDRKYEAVCLITATGGQTIFSAKKGSDLFKKMEEDARKCGADALVIRSSEDQTWKPLRGGIDQGAKSQAMAIRYLD
jgi:hypothetical protein